MKTNLLLIAFLTGYTMFAQIPSNPVREYLFSNSSLVNTAPTGSNGDLINTGSGSSFVNDRLNNSNSALSVNNTEFFGGSITANNTNPINEFGISFWYKFDQNLAAGTTENILRLTAGGTNNFIIRRTGNDIIEHRMTAGSETSVGTIQDPAIQSNSNFIHLYFNVRLETNQREIDTYINGTFVNTTVNSSVSTDLFSSNIFLNLGVISNGVGLEAILDDIRIYDRSLTTSEIQQLASEGLNTCTTFVNIPDANFKAILVADPNINTDGDTEICTTEAQAYTGPIGVSFSNIADLTGIEAFTNITALECFGNQITTLDVSNNAQLTRLYCYDNLLTTLTVGQNTIIDRIECGNNQLASLDVSQCPSLLLFTCSYNQLISLNVANGNNGNIGTLEANNNPNLNCIQHDIGFTPPTYDGISGWAKDATANWSDNCSTSSCTTFVNIPDANFKAALLDHGVGITGSGISIIDTDGDGEICTTEAQAYMGRIQASSLNISDLTGIEAFTNIDVLNCSNNNLSVLDVSNNISLTLLACGSNSLANLDVSNNVLLTTVECSGNMLTSLDFTNNSQLIEMTCLNNSLTDLNLANNNNGILSYMNAQNNPNLVCINHDSGFTPPPYVVINFFASGWAKDATANWSDNCSASSCTTFVNIPDANFKAALLDHGVGITGAGISVIDTDGDGEICTTEAQAYTGTIDVENQAIINLTGIEAFTNLNILNCGMNQMTTLDISQNIALTSVSCFSNLLNNLDVSNNTLLSVLTCGDNLLNNLDVSNNINLTNLVCSFNNLSDLDISSNTALTRLTINNNQLTSLNVANTNNNNVTFMDARFNPNLSCIQHDAGFNPNSNINWRKDNSATWSDNCVSACIVNIPDTIFKQALVGDAAININGDTEIQCSEASNFNGTIFVQGTIINLPIGTFFSGVSDFTGLEAFTSLTGLDLNIHPATSIDLSANTQLTSLDIDNTNVSSLNLSTNTLLLDIEMRFNNDLTALDLSNQAVLASLNLQGNALSSVVLPSSSSLNFINLRDNDLTSLDVTNLSSLEILFINDNPTLTSVDFSQNSLLETLVFSNTGLSVVNLSNNTNLTDVNGNDCVVLTQVNLQNGNNTNISAGNIDFLNCPNLICVQVDNVNYAQTNWTDVDNTSIFSTNCSLSLDDLDLNKNVSIYPNPVSNVIYIKSNQEVTTVNVYSLLGENVLSTSKKSLEVNRLESGVYIIQIKTESGQIAIKRFIKK
ncbi:MAG: T9SS type A sorting domain-containing protein [Winogradskyella sp.]|uniref:T9SS type A sorting domain-containing protein n=1 Tax=Winogradskyella sp. TaxID=1883156 RepID=UPI0025EA8822|nr:T9SS type A sorting domain-containing protein [Winogradskyella sp.]NRB60222.1 T9SS type A sorting domain-containing protein [Winogradskyella sp.]